jgi:hypothetical protein
MEAVPKIVRQRMRSAAKPGGHPQADLLTAFAEKALTERERTRVVEHLSRCEDCREVVFLATPQEEPSQVVGKIPDPTGWLSWPALRWGAAVACVVIVGTAVTLLHQDHGPQALSERADSEKAPSVAAAPAAVISQNRIADAEVKNSAPSRKDKDVEGNELAARVETPAQPSRKTMSAVPRIPMQFDRSRQINRDETAAGSESNAPAAPSPDLMAKSANVGDRKQSAASLDAGKASATADIAAVESGAQSTAENIAVEKDDAPPAGRALTSAQIQANSAPAVTSGNSGYFAKKEVARAPSIVTPRWMLTANGILQRSFDAGKTWDNIQVIDKVVFQTFAAVASEVWAGGANGRLYHSVDAGQHWNRVTPQVNGASLTAGITSIQFSDPQNGKITTANGETWATPDAGKTWQKR